MDARRAERDAAIYVEGAARHTADVGFNAAPFVEVVVGVKQLLHGQRFVLVVALAVLSCPARVFRSCPSTWLRAG